MKPDSFSKCGIDADMIAYRASFACQDRSDWDLEDTIDDLMNYIIGKTVVFPTGKNVAGYLTGKNNFRYDVATTYPYKGVRKDKEKPQHLPHARDYLIEKWGCAVVDGAEADDALATDAMSYHTPEQYVIVSGDKDFKTVPCWKYWFIKDVFEYNTEHEALLFFYEQILTGDKVDGIVGLYGTGPVKAKKILDGALTEQEMYARVVKAYTDSATLVGDPLDRVLENGRLLHLCRFEGEMWEPPV